MAASDNPNRILVVEDESTIAEAIASRLRSEGFEVDVTGNGLDAVRKCAELLPDLVVLDLNLPGLDGLEVCRQIQASRRTPVVMLTARDDETDLLVGLGVGADDYLTKPFSPRELVARIRAVLRRTVAQPGPQFAGSGIIIDPALRTVTNQGCDVHLTPTEFDLLLTLAEAGGAVLSREQLLFKVWGYRDGSGARTVDSHVRSLRRKLQDEIIRTVHGIGYGFGQGDQTGE